MTPAVRRLLREHELEASQIAGTGGGGRITREDVLGYVEAVRTGQKPTAPAASPGATPASTTVSGPIATQAPSLPPDDAWSPVILPDAPPVATL